MIQLKSVKSGSLVGEFRDRFGAQCSLQESSYTDETCLWVGVEVDAMGDSVTNGRMHLTQDQARELATALLYFANEGSLGKYDPDQHFQVGTWVRGISEHVFGVYGRVILSRQGQYLVVQDQNKHGREGQIHCAWGIVNTMWVPAEAPTPGRSLFARISDDD